MKLTFKDGQESRPVIEPKNIENSVFKNQYELAEKIFNTLLCNEEIRGHSNIISFCGDRGTGKTSCMIFKSVYTRHNVSSDVIVGAFGGVDFGVKRGREEL